MLTAATVLGLVIGAVIGGLGGGGGVLTVPALVYLLGESARDATTSSVIIGGVTAVVGALARIRSGGVDMRTAAGFGVVGGGADPFDLVGDAKVVRVDGEGIAVEWTSADPQVAEQIMIVLATLRAAQ